ncbi:uncharacterized protein [Amphiura filiformis]|uniref:uncharacterized protein isoform X1 n=1 Tax=Amphiura filiformis TaxID=82378 RepID=UPI003B21908A
MSTNITAVFGSNRHALKLGKSFSRDKEKRTALHSVRYDFKPASIDHSKEAQLDVGEKGEVTITLPNDQTKGISCTKFKGSKRPYQKECVLIYDHTTGEFTLEKLSSNIQVKKQRQETVSRPQLTSRPRSTLDPSSAISSKTSPNRTGSGTPGGKKDAASLPDLDQDALDTFVTNMCKKGHVDRLVDMYARKMGKRGQLTAKSQLSASDRKEIADFVDFVDDNRDETLMNVYTMVRNMPSQTGPVFKTKVLEYECSGDVMMHTCKHLLQQFEDVSPLQPSPIPHDKPDDDDSSSSYMSDSDSDDSKSSDEEDKQMKVPKESTSPVMHKSPVKPQLEKLKTNQKPPSPCVISQLSRDLQLSESDSDSD